MIILDKILDTLETILLVGVSAICLFGAIGALGCLLFV